MSNLYENGCLQVADVQEAPCAFRPMEARLGLSPLREGLHSHVKATLAGVESMADYDIPVLIGSLRDDAKGSADAEAEKKWA